MFKMHLKRRGGQSEPSVVEFRLRVALRVRDGVKIMGGASVRGGVTVIHPLSTHTSILNTSFKCQ